MKLLKLTRQAQAGANEMSFGDFGIGGGVVGGVLTALYILGPHLLKRRIQPDRPIPGDSHASIQQLVQENYQRDVIGRLDRVETRHEKDHDEMMKCLGEIRDFLRDLTRMGRERED